VWLGTWIGCTLGMVAADALATIVGAMLGKKLPEDVIKIGATVLCALLGVLLIIDGTLARATLTRPPLRAPPN